MFAQDLDRPIARRYFSIMTQDRERWAEALAIERLHGANARQWLNTRIETLARAGDQAGVERMMTLRAMIEQLDGSQSR